MLRTSSSFETARHIQKLNGAGGQAEGSLPKGPSREERELMQMYDLAEAKIRRLPPGLQWREIRVRRTDHGLSVGVTV